MVVGNFNEVKANPVLHPAAKDATMKVLIGQAEGWEDYVMRVVELEEGGHSPRHEHPWPHINYVIQGEGLIHIDGTDYPVKEGAYSYVPSDVVHQYVNQGKGMFKFICIVPKEGHI